ncbi:MAG TPA: ABC transporter permease, partial [Terriglobales bacterium]|nr:ABC transporter permease [Terriglobales bacterium]
MQSLLRNFRYAFRQLRSSPGFAITAILTLTIGIGGTVAVFSVFDAVLLRPLPFKDPRQLISIHERSDQDTHELRVGASDVLTFQRESKAFSGVAGYISAAYELTGAGSPFEARAERVSASLFPTLGIEPILGRTFDQHEDESSIPAAVISYMLWKERFQSDRDVLGRTVDLDRRPYTIVGVMPRNFEFPIDAGRLSHRDLWIPLSLTPTEKNSEGASFDFSLIARLRPGVSSAQAQQDVDRVITAIDVQYPGMARIGLHAFFRPVKEEITQNAQSLLRILLGAVALILLIACVNLANLLLVRAAGRRREFGVRLALGAASKAMFWQVMSESVLLSAVGGIFGIALAVVLVRVNQTIVPDSLPRLGEIDISWPVLAFATGLTGATGLVCGIMPALSSMRTNILDSIREGSVAAGQGRGQHRTRTVLVVAEIALAMVLLAGSGLLLRSLARMLAVDPGFEPAHVLKASLSLPTREYSSQQKVNDFYSELQRRLETLPGVKAAGFSSNIPVVGQNSGRLIAPEGYVKSSGEGWIIASNYLVHGDYFQAMHIPLLRGRYFTPGDDVHGAPLTVVISQSLANKYFAGKDPVGMHIKVGPSFASSMPAMTIVGVIGDIKQGSLDLATVPEMYEPLSQAAGDLGSYGAMIGVIGGLNAVVRTTGDPAALGEAFTKTVRQLDPLLAVSEMQTMEEVVAATESPRRFNTEILTAFATIALLLSLLGIYGTMAHTVAERNREIAIRMAVGASRESVLLNILRNAFAVAIVGIIAGLALSAALTRIAANLLFDVKPLDILAMGGAMATLLLSSILAAWLPARRAASVEPMQLLRFE